NNLADDYMAAGRHTDALKLIEETFARGKARLGPDHPETLAFMTTQAEALLKLGRGKEAVVVIDECFPRAAKNPGAGWFIPDLLALRLRYFEKAKDATGCRQTAEMWEKLNRADANSLYTAGCMRAVAADVIKGDPKIPSADAPRLFKAEA